MARLHLTMEGIGLGDANTPHLRSTAPRPVGERLEDDENIDGDGGGGGVEAEKRRAREFERSEQRFDRRKEEIGQIMSKVSERHNPRFRFRLSFEANVVSGRGTQLDDVSQALAAFHTLDTPVFNSAVAATSHPMSVSATSTPVGHHASSRPPDLHRISLEASPRGREEFFVDSPLAIRQAPSRPRRARKLEWSTRRPMPLPQSHESGLAAVDGAGIHKPQSHWSVIPSRLAPELAYVRQGFPDHTHFHGRCD